MENPLQIKGLQGIFGSIPQNSMNYKIQKLVYRISDANCICAAKIRSSAVEFAR
jgi:hypothetical protein